MHKRWLIAYSINCLIAAILTTFVGAIILWAEPGKTWFQTCIMAVLGIAYISFAFLWLLAAYRIR